MGQVFVCFFAHKAHKSNPKTLCKVPACSATGRDSIIYNNNKMQNLKLNELSKQQMSQITGGHGCESIITNYHGKEARVSVNATYTKTGTISTLEVCCVCGCVYANQGGSSSDANFTANDAKNLKSF